MIINKQLLVEIMNVRKNVDMFSQIDFISNKRILMLLVHIHHKWDLKSSVNVDYGRI